MRGGRAGVQVDSLILLILLLLVLTGVDGGADGEFTGDYSKLSGIIIPGFASTQLGAWSIDVDSSVSSTNTSAAAANENNTNHKPLELKQPLDLNHLISNLYLEDSDQDRSPDVTPVSIAAPPAKIICARFQHGIPANFVDPERKRAAIAASWNLGASSKSVVSPMLLKSGKRVGEARSCPINFTSPDVIPSSQVLITLAVSDPPLKHLEINTASESVSMPVLNSSVDKARSVCGIASVSVGSLVTNLISVPAAVPTAIDLVTPDLESIASQSDTTLLKPVVAVNSNPVTQILDSLAAPVVGIGLVADIVKGYDVTANVDVSFKGNSIASDVGASNVCCCT